MSKNKYRAWDEDCEVMYYSDKECDDCCFGFHEGRVVAWLRETEPQTIDEPAHDYGKPIDVEQFIGRADKNGTDIYEGDICKNGDWETDAHAWNYRVEVIEWDADSAMWDGWNPNEHGMCCEVIGNIHADAHLLKQRR